MKSAVIREQRADSYSSELTVMRKLSARLELVCRAMAADAMHADQKTLCPRLGASPPTMLQSSRATRKQHWSIVLTSIGKTTPYAASAANWNMDMNAF